MTDSPRDPITQLMAAAVQMHEPYEAFIKAGFSKEQAMELVIAVVQKPTP